MLEDVELLEFIINKCKELGISGYEIGQKTELPEQTAYKILSGASQNPRRKNLLIILDFLEKKQLGTNPEGKKEKQILDYTLEDKILQVHEGVDAIYKKATISDIFTDVGTELLIAYKKQISIFELNVELYKENSNLLREKIVYLTSNSTN